MARNTAPEDEPTSNWDHSHAVQEGDELETEHGEVWQVTTVQDDGAIRVRRIDDGRRDANERDAWGEDAVRTSLAHDEMKRVRDGKSHELATF